jgi:hypothetical protein
MSKTILKLGPAYTDERGIIQMILEDEPITSVSIISSKAGSTRASHWHCARRSYLRPFAKMEFGIFRKKPSHN